MKNNILYIYTFFIAYFILYLIKNDLKKFKIKIYNELNYKIWAKVYLLILICMIHLTWLFLILFLNYNDKNIIYGLPYFLFVPYFAYILIDSKNDNNNTIADQKINKYLNYLMSIYFIFIIFLIIIPNQIKKNLLECFLSMINIYLIK